MKDFILNVAILCVYVDRQTDRTIERWMDG